MTYRTLSDLPKVLRKELPRHAQEIYLAAHTRTWEQCTASQDYEDERSIAETAHKAGLFAVEMEYERDEHGRWRRASVGKAMDKSKMRKEA